VKKRNQGRGMLEREGAKCRHIKLYVYICYGVLPSQEYASLSFLILSLGSFPHHKCFPPCQFGTHLAHSVQGRKLK
jgi:hypothetical protein